MRIWLEKITATSGDYVLHTNEPEPDLLLDRWASDERGPFLCNEVVQRFFDAIRLPHDERPAPGECVELSSLSARHVNTWQRTE